MPGSAKRRPLHHAATLSDVGRAAGVSAMAASAVLNGARTSSRISEETRRKIIAAAAALNYRPNAAARALANRRMHAIGVAAIFVGPEVNQYFLEVFTGILERAGEQRQNTTVFTLGSWATDAGRLAEFCDGRIDGLILIAPVLPREAARDLPAHVPFVALHANTPLPNVVNLESDEETGAYELVRHLIATGHRRIMHVAGQPGIVGAERRLRGYQRALRDAGLKLDDHLIVPASFAQEHAREALRQWLRRHRGHALPQAIFAVNDSSALGCIETLAEVGLRVPEDISVAGFDDTMAARTMVPQLTTVRQPLRDMGHRAVDVLLDLIAHRREPSEMPPPPIVFPTEIRHRASVTHPPSGTRLVPAV